MEELDRLARVAGSGEGFDLYARLYHHVAGMCLKEHGVELRPSN